MTLSYSFFQHYWFFIDALLGALLVFLLFVQGGQTFLFSLGRSPKDRTLMVNALGRKWEFTFTTLVTFGGAFFASFPLFYSSSFGGAYWVWTIILLAFVVQAVSYEFRSKKNNALGKTTFDVFLLINGVLGTVLIGTAVATFYTGSEFSINQMKSVEWHGALRGLEAALNFHNLSLGLAVFFLARVNALLYFLNAIADTDFIKKVKKRLLYNVVGFLFFFLTFVIWLLVRDGFAVDAQTQTISKEGFKYLHNLIEMPQVGTLFLIGVLLVLFGIYKAVFTKKEDSAIWFTGIGTVLTVLSLLLIAGFNHTAFYPSSYDLQSSLTIENASSSFFTLKVMSVVSLLIPFVLAYIWWAWRNINNKKLTHQELEEDEVHVY